MRVVDISEFFSDFGGGVRTYVHQKLEICAALGAETTIIAPGPADRRERRLGGEIIWVRSPVLPVDHRYHLFARARPVHDLLDDLRPDLVEGSSTWRGAWIAANWRGASPRSLFLHQDPVAVYPQSMLSPAISEERIDALCGWFWTYLARLAVKFDATIAPSVRFADRLERHGVVRPFACPLGVDDSVFSHERRDERLRAAMLAACGQPDPKAALFIAVSRHHPEKRLPMLIEGFAKAARDRPAALYIIGDGPMWRGLARKGARAGRVFLAGPARDREDVARRLASADYLVHGGAAETFGLVVAEALCCGLPVVAPDRGGAAELSHPAYAESYRAGDAGALSAAIMRILARDRATLSVAARAGAKRIGSAADHVRRLLSIYENLAKARPQTPRASTADSGAQ